MTSTQRARARPSPARAAPRGAKPSAKGIYLYTPDSDRFHTLSQTALRGDWRQSKLEGPKPVASSWRRVKVALDTHGRRGDFPSFLPHVPVFSRRALDALQPKLGDAIEALPLDCGRHEFFAIHVLDVIDGLDERRSNIKRFPSGGVMYIGKHVFDEERVGDRLLFRLSQAPLGVYYTEEFRRAVKAAKLEGLVDRKVFP